MAIFKSVFEAQTDIDIELESSDVDVEFDESDTFDDTLTEYCKEMYALDAVMYIMDVQLEHAAFDGADSVETVAENALTDFFKKIKEQIIKIWNNIKTWIRKKVLDIRAGFAASSSFMKKHGDEIPEMIDKGAKDYIFTGPAFNAINALSTKFKSFGGVIEKRLADIRSGAVADTTNAMLIGDLAKEFDKKGEVNSIGELGTVILDYARGTQYVDKHPDKALVKLWVETCENASSILNEIDKSAQEVEKNVKNALSQIKKLESEAKKKDNTTDAATYHAQGRLVAQLIALQTKCTTYTINACIEGVKTLSSRCKAIYKKGKKGEDENTETANESYTSSLFENAFNYL